MRISSRISLYLSKEVARVASRIFSGRAFPDLIPPLLPHMVGRVCEAISARRIFGLAACNVMPRPFILPNSLEDEDQDRRGLSVNQKAGFGHSEQRMA